MLGYVWQVLNPLLLFGVLYVFFVVISKVGGLGKPDEQFYGVQLLGSIILFTFFGEATGGAVRSVVDRENLVRKIQFPRLVIPLAITLLAFFNLMMNLIVVLIFALISGVQPMLSWLELPLILMMLVLFSTGLAMLLSAMFVHFRDIQPIWMVVSQIVFYGSPVIIPLEKVRETLLYPKPPGTPKPFLYHLYMLNPLVTVFQQFRHAMVTHGTISAGQALGSWAACSSRSASRSRSSRSASGAQPLRAVRRGEPVGTGRAGAEYRVSPRGSRAGAPEQRMFRIPVAPMSAGSSPRPTRSVPRSRYRPPTSSPRSSRRRDRLGRSLFGAI